MIYNFRIDRSQTPEVLRRLTDDQMLSQGWGGGVANSLSLLSPDFISATKQAYSLTSTRLATNLSRMAQLKDGDLVVTPHIPSEGRVSIHVVDGDFPACYHYQVSDETHLNHRIHVKESFGLEGNVHMRNAELGPWYSKVPWLRLPVLAIGQYEALFTQLLVGLKGNPSKEFGVSELTDFLDGLAQKVERLVHAELGKMPPSAGNCSFESLCANMLESHGYTVSRKNFYDGTGGDVDIVCERSRSDSSPFEIGRTKLYVQVKRHFGVTDHAGVNQLRQMISKADADGCLITLAEDFSESARALADEDGIRLIDGHEFSRIVLQAIASRPVPRADV
jgi:hypothetical protein